MNVIAIDIGNTNIRIGLFLEGEEQSVEIIGGGETQRLKAALEKAWNQVPILESSAEGKRDGVIVVSSVKPSWTEQIRAIAIEALGEKVSVVGQEIPLPIAVWVDEPGKVGTDRVVSAAAAHAVVDAAVVVADFGTAVTIDLVDQNGVFQGGVIYPGFDIAAKALKDNTAQLPQVRVTRPSRPLGKNTADAINCGLYYGCIGAMEEIVRRYAEDIGQWPQTVITGSGAEMIKDDCPFVDNYVPNLVLKGIVLAYHKFIEAKSEIA